MSAPLQLIGGVAIALGSAGTLLAGRRRTGWLVCIASSVLWLPALVTGHQWAAVLNVALSVVICVNNFLAGDRTVASPPAPAPARAPVAVPPRGWRERAVTALDG